jgi:hypothetical protein
MRQSLKIAGLINDRVMGSEVDNINDELLM